MLCYIFRYEPLNLYIYIHINVYEQKVFGVYITWGMFWGDLKMFCFGCVWEGYFFCAR